DVPGDRDHELAVHAGKRQDARPRLAEALGDPADRAPEGARVEQVGGLDDGELRLGQATQDRLADDRLIRRRALEERAETAPLPAGERDRRRRRAPLLHPAVVERDVLAERAHVDELAVAVRREPHRTLPDQERPLADSARPRDGVSRDAHRATIAKPLPRVSCYRLPTCVIYM